MAPSKILDTHIHLWPSTSTTSAAHGWMTPGNFLAKRHGISDYLAVAQPNPDGFVYVETDRYLPVSAPDFKGDVEVELKEWAHEPLEEIKFLRRILEGNTEDGDGVEAGQGEKMKGCVIWAPFHLPPSIFQTWLKMAQETAGPILWNNRIVGFRYLVQGKGDGEVARLVSSGDWLTNIVSLSKGRDGKGWTFDVGVDINRDGEEGLRAVGGMIAEVRKREGDGGSVKFVLNHLCKPPLSHSKPSPAWISAMQNFRNDENVFMKLSGAFNEFSTSSPTPSSIEEMVVALKPYLDVVFENFKGRVMFGSDWPVCNVGGPKGEQGNWTFWREVVEAVLQGRGLSDESGSIWWRAGARAYGVKL